MLVENIYYYKTETYVYHEGDNKYKLMSRVQKF